MSPTRSAPRRKSRILLDCGTNEVEFLRFFVGPQFFGINVSKVRRAIVFEQEMLSAVPHACKGYFGTYLYRGVCIPVISFKEYFDLGVEDLNKRTILLVCDFNQTTVGYLVDGIKDILRCSWDNFQPAKQVGSNSAVLSGNLLAHSEITPILDVEEMLTQILPEAGLERALSRLEPGVQSSTLKNKRVVYCEDSPTVQRILLQALQAVGLKDVRAFNSGTEGIEYIKSHPDEIDLVISDIEMPQLDGLTLCREIKAASQTQKIPFIFFSSTVTDEMRLKCQSVGGIAAFAKPEIGLLAAYVQNMLA